MTFSAAENAARNTRRQVSICKICNPH
jgi:hypothetical protein